LILNTFYRDENLMSSFFPLDICPVTLNVSYDRVSFVFEIFKRISPIRAAKTQLNS